MLTATCGNCGKVYRVKDEYAGRKFACKQCGKAMRVAGEPPVPNAAPARVVPAPPPIPVVPLPAEDAEYDVMASLESTGEADNSIPMVQTAYAPATRVGTSFRPPAVPKVKGSRVGFRLNWVVLLCGLGGIILAIVGGQELMVSNGATETPQDITCSELAANGPGTNAHVRVSKFYSMANYVYQHDESGKWLTTWLPIIPREAIKKPVVFKGAGKVIPKDLVDSSDIHVLVKTHIITCEPDVTGAMHRDTVEGMVINKIEKVPQEEQDLLHQAYPALSLDNCWIIEDGREPKRGAGLGMLVGGIVLTLIGLVAMFRPVS